MSQNKYNTLILPLVLFSFYGYAEFSVWENGIVVESNSINDIKPNLQEVDENQSPVNIDDTSISEPVILTLLDTSIAGNDASNTVDEQPKDYGVVESVTVLPPVSFTEPIPRVDFNFYTGHLKISGVLDEFNALVFDGINTEVFGKSLVKAYTGDNHRHRTITFPGYCGSLLMTKINSTYHMWLNGTNGLPYELQVVDTEYSLFALDDIKLKDLNISEFKSWVICSDHLIDNGTPMNSQYLHELLNNVQLP